MCKRLPSHYFRSSGFPLSPHVHLHFTDKSPVTQSLQSFIKIPRLGSDTRKNMIPLFPVPCGIYSLLSMESSVQKKPQLLLISLWHLKVPADPARCDAQVGWLTLRGCFKASGIQSTQGSEDVGWSGAIENRTSLLPHLHAG